MNNIFRSDAGKRVLILFPPFHEHLYGDKWKRSESPFAPLGINYIATPISRAGYSVSVIDLQVDHLDEVQYLDKFRNADFILISCFTFALDIIQIIIRDIRYANGDAVIICGGPLCTETGNHIENSDITVFGEADLMIVRVLDAASMKKSLADIQGISYRENGKYIRNPGKVIVENLDLISVPAFDLTRGKDYGYIYGIKLKNFYPVITTRGCPFKCTFCTFQNVKYRERSVEHVIREIKQRLQEGARYLVFCDDNFLLNRQRVLAILDNIARCKSGIRIIIQGRVDMIDYELCLKMKEAGVIMVIFGIESVNQDVLDFYNKRTTTEKIRNAIRVLNRAGIITISGLIIGAPIEEMKHFEKTIEFFREMPQDFINVNILRYQYPSPLWFQANVKGLIKDEEMVVCANEKLSNFSYEALLDIQTRIIRSFYNNPGRILRIIYKLSMHFGILVLFKVLLVYWKKTIYKAPQELHR